MNAETIPTPRTWALRSSEATSLAWKYGSALASHEQLERENIALRAALVKIAIGGDDEGTFTALELCRIARAAVPDWGKE